MSQINESLTVRSLVCHRDVDMAILCLGSLLKFSSETIHLVIHDDSSLTDEDIDKLQSGFQNCDVNHSSTEIIRRDEADELMQQQLQLYPNALKYRNANVVGGLKLLDIPLLSQGDIAFCDSDILFLRPFQRMFYFPNTETSAIFQMDCREAYAILPWKLLTLPKIKLAQNRAIDGENYRVKLLSRVNSGLMFIRKKAYDLDFIEWLVSQNICQSDIFWHGQTYWSAIGYHIGSQQYNPQQVVVVQSKQSITDETIAAHFVSRYRHFLGYFANQVNHSWHDINPVAVETISSKKCNLFNLSLSLMRYKLGIWKHNVMRKKS
ncbi:hypothetical protein [Calothrix sp. UHCC 0171]|uniref:hypothetical protein n=1 Tax=Calothrix sp. UHCC 0171 TaxID=3110245 RepID=UPI002B20EDF6|nr:hypothetical protein [Calothrix sp. UHCC 0171]MEA5573950.1 hypothetical protein [Calothrix sp. UHCC 0171]